MTASEQIKKSDILIIIEIDLLVEGKKDDDKVIHFRWEIPFNEIDPTMPVLHFDRWYLAKKGLSMSEFMQFFSFER